MRLGSKMESDTEETLSHMLLEDSPPPDETKKRAWHRRLQIPLGILIVGLVGGGIVCLLSLADSKDVERVKTGNISLGDFQERERRNLLSGNEMPRQTSGLKWISKEKVENLPGGFYNQDLVRSRNQGLWKCSRTDPSFCSVFCRAQVDGCYYPGEVWWWTGMYSALLTSHCTIISKTKVQKRSDFQVLYNPDGVAQYTWLPWPEGTSNTNFPNGVVRSSNERHCSDLKLARYHDNKEPALVDGAGYVYYNYLNTWYWDNNEYDLLVEKTVTKIELLELNYGDILNRTVRRFEGEGDKSTSETLMTNSDSTETQISQTLEMQYTERKSWSHSIEVSVGVGVEVEVTSPGKALLGGAAARYGFDLTFSYAHGWGSEEERTHCASVEVKKIVPARTRVKVKMFMLQTTMDVPYTAKYRLTYEDGSVKTVRDKGVMKNAIYSNSQVEVGQSESF